MARQITLDSEPPIEVIIDDVKWTIPGDIPLKEVNRIMSLLGPDAKKDPEAAGEAMTELNDFVAGLFSRHHTKEEVEKLDLGFLQMVRLLNLAYFPEEAEPDFFNGRPTP